MGWKTNSSRSLQIIQNNYVFVVVFFKISENYTNSLRLIQEYTQLDQKVFNDTRKCYAPRVFLNVFFKIWGKKQNILSLLQECTQLDQNVLNDTHKCYVRSAVFCCIFQDLGK